jgi:DNA processing protein
VTVVEHLVAWFQLKSVPGIGNLMFKRLLDRFGSPEAVFETGEEQLLTVEGMTSRLVRALRRPPGKNRFKPELSEVEGKGFAIVTLNDPSYPQLLREIPDPPPFLYVHGRLSPSRRKIAVVGSRNPTRYGLEVSRKLSADLTVRGLTVVSGMATGIDTAAHEGALLQGGETVAVLGSGFNRIYPSGNRGLCGRIAASGAVVSELPLNSGPDAHHFPVRNRIISGMSLGSLVVEAGLKSGSLITARLAAEQNREVFAVPGSIHSFKSTGTHALIKRGAKLVAHAGDVVEELCAQLPVGPAEVEDVGIDGEAPVGRLSAEEARVLKMLDPYPIHIDDLVRKLQIDAGQLSALLLQLEIKGLIRQMPGKYFSIANK